MEHTGKRGSGTRGRGPSPSVMLRLSGKASRPTFPLATGPFTQPRPPLRRRRPHPSLRSRPRSLLNTTPPHTHPTEQPPTHPSRTRASTHLRSTRRRREAIRRERRRAIRREGAGAGAGRRRPHAPPGDGLELLPTAASTSLPAQPPRPGLDLPL
jgi:hypothetical protein